MHDPADLPGGRSVRAVEYSHNGHRISALCPDSRISLTVSPALSASRPRISSACAASISVEEVFGRDLTAPLWEAVPPTASRILVVRARFLIRQFQGAEGRAEVRLGDPFANPISRLESLGPARPGQRWINEFDSPAAGQSINKSRPVARHLDIRQPAGPPDDCDRVNGDSGVHRASSTAPPSTRSDRPAKTSR